MSSEIGLARLNITFVCILATLVSKSKRKSKQRILASSFSNDQASDF